MAFGLFMAHFNGTPAVPVTETPHAVSIGQALYHLLTASMRGLVALSGLEAMSNGIQFVKNEDAGIIAWGKKRLPRFKGFWGFYSGKSGIGRIVQTSFLFYGGITTLMLAAFSIRFDVFDGTLGRTLVGNLSFIGFSQIPGGTILFWAYQILAVMLLTAASMTAFQDLQATEWRDVAIGEIPEIIVYRDPRGTFTRSVTISYIITMIIMFVVKGNTSAAIPYYGVGVFMPIMVMGFSIRKHILQNYTGRVRKWGSLGAGFAGVLSAVVFIGQIVGKWQDGGWVVLISFSVLILAANILLISPIGIRTPAQIHRIVREKARVQGSMASIVEWQSLKMQEYRYTVLLTITHFFELLGLHRPLRYDPPAPAGDYDHALHSDHPEAPSFLSNIWKDPKNPAWEVNPKKPPQPMKVIYHKGRIACPTSIITRYDTIAMRFTRIAIFYGI